MKFKTFDSSEFMSYIRERETLYSDRDRAYADKKIFDRINSYYSVEIERLEQFIDQLTNTAYLTEITGMHSQLKRLADIMEKFTQPLIVSEGATPLNIDIIRPDKVFLDKEKSHE